MRARKRCKDRMPPQAVPATRTIHRTALPGAFVGSLLLLLSCASTDGPARLGTLRCERFFVYSLCVSDLDRDGRVDFMYFDDSREIFMYADEERAALDGLLPFHDCAIPMSTSTREYSSALLYGSDLPLSERLALKGRLLRNYRDAQPAVEACNRRQERLGGSAEDAAPFVVPEPWDQGPG